MAETVSAAQPWLAVKKPPAIAALATDPRGIPIFFVVQAPPGRVFSFKVINPAHQDACGRRKLCAICGGKLDYRFVFLGDLESYRWRSFGFGPMHRVCLDYAQAVCPFLVGRYESKHLPPADPLVRRSDYLVAERADVSVVYETRGLRGWGAPAPHELLLFLPAAPTRLEFYDRDRQPIPAPVLAPQLVGRRSR